MPFNNRGGIMLVLMLIFSSAMAGNDDAILKKYCLKQQCLAATSAKELSVQALKHWPFESGRPWSISALDERHRGYSVVLTDDRTIYPLRLMEGADVFLQDWNNYNRDYSHKVQSVASAAELASKILTIYRQQRQAPSTMECIQTNQLYTCSTTIEHGRHDKSLTLTLTPSGQLQWDMSDLKQDM